MHPRPSVRVFHLPDTQGDHQTADSVSASWDAIPSKDLLELPPLLATVYSRSSCGWTEVSLSILCHRHTECCSVLTTDGSRSHRSVVMAHPLLRLSVAGRMGNVFDGRFIWLSMSKEGDCFSTTGICVSVATPGKTPLTY